jgi:hypothetical protein
MQTDIHATCTAFEGMRIIAREEGISSRSSHCPTRSRHGCRRLSF